jgi:hypothetical protein
MTYYANHCYRTLDGAYPVLHRRGSVAEVHDRCCWTREDRRTRTPPRSDGVRQLRNAATSGEDARGARLAFAAIFAALGVWLGFQLLAPALSP